MALRKRQQEQKTKEKPVGSANQSQLVGTFGVGAIYELRGWHRRKAVASSVMIGGLDLWPKEDMSLIKEPALESILNVKELREPPPANEKNAMRGAIPAVRFPEWMSCSSCGRMGTVRSGHFQEESAGVAICSASSCDGYGMPSRLIVACEGGEKAANHGHISDFPWGRWCHFDFRSDRSVDSITCDRHQLFLRSLKGKPGLDGLRVECKSCGHGNSLKYALSAKYRYLFECQGDRPWLRLTGAGKHQCDFPVRILLRGATNVYFPVTTSVISIPPFSSALYQKMVRDPNLPGFLTMLRTAAGIPVDILVNGFVQSSPWADTFSQKEIADALVHFAEYGRNNLYESLDDRLSEERLAIVQGHISQKQDGDQFLARPVSTEKLGELDGWIENLVLIERLREVRALSGFTRVHDGSSFERVAKLGMDETWLPAINVYGEGIYLELNQERLSALEEQFAARISFLHKRAKEKGMDVGKSSAAFIALHTLSHILMRQLSLECGYSSSSLRERLYFKQGHYAGVLIYTATASSDGTLGGLVQQGAPSNLARIIRDALQEASWCSSDPLCIDSEGQGSFSLNLAACYACSQAPETSCDEKNIFLDRGVLIGAGDVGGYWSDF